MAELIGAVTKVTNAFLEINQISIDNWGFKLFYKATTSILIACSVLVVSTQFFGSPIQCDAGSAANGVEKDVLESYCWMYSSWSIPAKYKGVCSANGELTGLSVDEWNKARTTIVYNSYYQWVPLYLVTLAIVFYIPRLIWLMLEGGLMKFFGNGTTTRTIEDQEEKEQSLVKFFCKNVHNKYNIYFYGFIVCEILNVFIVTVQFGVTNQFLHGRFLDYGPKVIYYYRLPDEEQALNKNPMCYAFPRIASCDYWRWGPGGLQENINAICILALNMINDKVFLVLWWWFLFVSIVGVTRLIYRLVQTQSSFVRYQLINLRMNRYFKKSTKLTKIESFITQATLGDWFVLYQLSKNLNRPFFMDFLTHLSVKYDDEYLDSDDDEKPLMNQMEGLLKQSNLTVSQSKAPLCKEEETAFNSKDFDNGDNLFEMLTQPRLDDVDGKKKKKKDDEDDDDDDDEEDEKEEKGDDKKKKKSNGDDNENGPRRGIGTGSSSRFLDDDDDENGKEDRPDIPDGGYSPRKKKQAPEFKAYKPSSAGRSQRSSKRY